MRIRFYGPWELCLGFLIFGKYLRILWGFAILWGFYGLWGTNMEEHNECDKLIVLIKGLSNPR